MNLFPRSVLLIVALWLAGCKARPPNLELECTIHQDCALISLGTDCCDGCLARVGNKSSVAALAAWCAARPPASCPQLDCPNTVATPMCDRGRCLARPGVHPL